VTGISLYSNSNSAKAAILRVLNRNINGRIEWKRQRISLVSGRCVIDAVALSLPGHRPCIAVDTLSASVSFVDLIRKKIRIKELLLHNPKITAEIDTGGILNLAALFAPMGGEGTSSDPAQFLPVFPLKIGRIHIKNGGFRFINRSGDVPVDLDNVNIQAGLNLFVASAHTDIVIAGCSLSGKEKSVRIDTIQCGLALKKSSIDTADIVIKTGNSSVKISGSVANIVQNPEFAITIAPDVLFQDIAACTGMDSTITGRLTGTVRLNGILDDPSADLSLSGNDMKVGEMTVDSIRCKSRLQSRIVHIDSLALFRHSGSLVCLGSVDVQQVFTDGFVGRKHPAAGAAIYDISLNGTNINLADLTAGVNGRCDFRAGIKGSGFDPKTADASLRISARIHSPAIKMRNKQDVLAVSAGARLEDGRLIADTVSVESGAGAFHAQGSYDIRQNSVDFRCTADELDLEQIASLFSLPEMNGYARVRAEISGSLPVPEIRAGVSVRKYSYKNIGIDTAFVRAYMDSTGKIDVAELDITAEKSFVSAAGSLDIFKPGTFVLRKDPQITTRSFLGTLFLEEFFDSIRGKVDIGAQVVTGLHAGAGSVRLNGAGLSFWNIPCDSAALVLMLAQDTVSLVDGQLFLHPDDIVLMKGSVTRDSLSYDFTADAKDFSLNFLHNFIKDTVVQGDVTVSVKGGGRGKEVSMRGRISGNRISVGKTPLAGMGVDFTLCNDSVTVQGIASDTITGRYLFANRRIDAAITLMNSGLAPYLAFAGYPGIQGRATGSVSLQGPVDSINNISISAEFSDLTLVSKKELVRTNGLKVFYNNGIFNVQPAELVLLGAGRVAVSGSGNIQGAYDFTVSGMVPFSIIETFVPEITGAKGSVQLQAKLQGAKTGPRINGNIFMDSLGFTVPALNQELHAVCGTVRVSGKKAEITGMSGKLDEGFFAGKGELFLKDFIPETYSLNLQTNQLPLNIESQANFVVNSELSISGDRRKASVQGRIDLADGVFYENFDNVAFILDAVTGKKSGAPARKENKTSFWSAASCDIYLIAQKNFLIDNNIAQLEIRPDLHFTGKLLEPVVNGRAEAVSGTIVYKQNTFQVKRGIAEYFNAYYHRPAIDIEAETKVRDWTIVLKITGTPPDNLQLVLKSEPPLSDQNIVSLLLLRKTTDEITGAKGYYALSLEQVMDILSGPVSENLKKRTGIDILTIKTESSGSVDGTNLSVNLGKNLSKRVTTYYTLENEKGAINQKATVEYKLLDNIMLRTFNDTEGKFGGEAKLEFEFR